MARILALVTVVVARAGVVWDDGRRDRDVCATDGACDGGGGVGRVIRTGAAAALGQPPVSQAQASCASSAALALARANRSAYEVHGALSWLVEAARLEASAGSTLENYFADIVLKIYLWGAGHRRGTIEPVLGEDHLDPAH